MDKINLYLDALSYVFPWLLPALFGVLGAVFGSFITCVSYRVPRGLSIVKPRSYCPSCQTTLTAKSLVPVFSYLWFRKKCAHCGVSIPSRYALIELLCIVCGGLSYILFGAHIKAFVCLFFLLCAVYMVWSYVESNHKAYNVLLFFIIAGSLLWLL